MGAVFIRNEPTEWRQGLKFEACFLAAEILAKRIGFHAFTFRRAPLQFGGNKRDWSACLGSLARKENSDPRGKSERAQKN